MEILFLHDIRRNFMRYTLGDNQNDKQLMNYENDFFRGFFDYPFHKIGKNMQMMKTDIKSIENYYIFEIDVPGLDLEDIKIHIGEKYLTIHAKKQEEKEINEKGYIMRERHLGACSRSFYIGNIKESEIKASYKNGTLTIKVPKQSEREEEKNRFIPIERS